MKNKLEKTGHKRFYYRVRGVFHVFLFSLIGLSLLAVPVGITYHIAETKAQTIEHSSSSSSHSQEASEEKKESSFSGINDLNRIGTCRL